MWKYNLCCVGYVGCNYNEISRLGGFWISMWLVLRVKRCVKVCYKNGICWNWLRLICYSHHNNVNNTRPEDFPPQSIRSALSPISHHPQSTENPEATVKSNKTLCPETEKNSQCQSKFVANQNKFQAVDTHTKKPLYFFLTHNADSILFLLFSKNLD